MESCSVCLQICDGHFENSVLHSQEMMAAMFLIGFSQTVDLLICFEHFPNIIPWEVFFFVFGPF